MAQQYGFGYSPDEEQWLIENGFSAERGFSAEYLQMSPEQQVQVGNEIMDDLEQNWEVHLERDEEDGCLHARLYPKGE